MLFYFILSLVRTHELNNKTRYQIFYHSTLFPRRRDGIASLSPNDQSLLTLTPPSSRPAGPSIRSFKRGPGYRPCAIFLGPEIVTINKVPIKQINFLNNFFQKEYRSTLILKLKYSSFNNHVIVIAC